jgi:hypothetical protein
MCDPISIIGLGLSIGMAAANYSAQQEMAAQQQAANDSWVDYQRREAAKYAQRDEQLRRNAEAARTGATSELTAEKQKGAQENEEARLKDVITPEELVAMAEGDASEIDKHLLSGQQNTAAPVKARMQQQIAQASQEARERIAALAVVQSYGGSQFGLTNRANRIFNTSGQDIRLASNERAGVLAAHNVAKSVEPIKIVQHGSSSLGGLSSGLAQLGGGKLGNVMASSITGQA